MLCLVCQLFIISTSAIDCLGRFVSEMTYHVSSGTLNLNLNLVGFRPYLQDQLVTFSALTLLVWSYDL